MPSDKIFVIQNHLTKKNGRIEINPNQLKGEETYDGFVGLQTNIENAKPIDVLSTYRGLW